MEPNGTFRDNYRALYYPFIEVNDPGWLLSAALFWDEISTITPDVKQPYSSRVSRELFDAQILTPYRANPRRDEIVGISEQISELITNPYFESLIGENHWSVRQSQEYPIHSDKIESNLRYELEELGLVRERRDGFLDMEGGLAAAYMLLLSVKVAEKKKSSLVTDHVEAFRAAEVARFPQSSNPNRIHYYPRKLQIVQRDFVDACINEMMITWFRVNPETDVKKILKFRKNRKNELERMKCAIFRANSSILTDAEISREGIQERARNYVQNEIQPGYDDLVRLLNEETVSFIPDTLEAVLYSEFPGGLVAAFGQTWALVAAPIFCFTIRSVKFLLKRRNALINSPWSYLYKSERAFRA